MNEFKFSKIFMKAALICYAFVGLNGYSLGLKMGPKEMIDSILINDGSPDEAPFIVHQVNVTWTDDEESPIGRLLLRKGAKQNSAKVKAAESLEMDSPRWETHKVECAAKCRQKELDSGAFGSEWSTTKSIISYCAKEQKKFSPLDYPENSFQTWCAATGESRCYCQLLSTPYIAGCTDPNASNYDALASIAEPGSCVYEGCSDPMAINFDWKVTIDNGSCSYYVSGCTNYQSVNYNPDAMIDDGSCIAPAEDLICFDMMASNYYGSGECIYN